MFVTEVRQIGIGNHGMANAIRDIIVMDILILQLMFGNFIINL